MKHRISFGSRQRHGTRAESVYPIGKRDGLRFPITLPVCPVVYDFRKLYLSRHIFTVRHEKDTGPSGIELLVDLYTVSFIFDKNKESLLWTENSESKFYFCKVSSYTRTCSVKGETQSQIRGYFIRSLWSTYVKFKTRSFKKWPFSKKIGV